MNSTDRKYEFWKLRSAEALYLLASRVFIAVISLIMIAQSEYYNSALFLFTFFFLRSALGFFISGKLESFNKKKILISLASIFLFICLVMYMALHVNTVNLPLIIVIAFGLAGVDSLFIAMIDAYIPLVVSRDKLEAAYRKTFLIQSIIDVFGIAIGMAGLEAFGINNLILSLLPTSLLCIVVLFSLYTINHIDRTERYSRLKLAESIKLFFHYRFEPGWALLSLMVNMILLPFSMMVIPFYVNQVIRQSAIYIGVIEAAASLGVIFSSLMIHKVVSRVIGQRRTVSIAFMLIGLCLSVLCYTDNMLAWILSAFLIGVAIVLNNVTIESRRSRMIPEQHRVKIQTIHHASINLANPVGFLIIGLFLSYNQYSYFILGGGIVIFLLSFAVYLVPDFSIIISDDHTSLNYNDLYGEK